MNEPQTVEYAGTIYATAWQAALAAVDTWMTASGAHSLTQAVRMYATDPAGTALDLHTDVHNGSWKIPNYEQPSIAVIRRFLNEWYEHVKRTT